MKQSQLIKKAKSSHWYRQGGGINMLYCSVPYRSGADTFDCQIFFKGINNYGYFNKDNEKRLLDNFINSHLKDKNYLADRIEKWEALVKRQNIFLEKLNKEGKTIIMVTHDPNLAQKHANTIYWLKDGKVEKVTRKKR